jgi:pyruvate/2-oxoglutarate dehydrogenase complex dihydrolipoamide dehydrogenase (E3) component
MADILKPDLCIIGAGSGGLTVAAAARAFGASVVLVERGKMGGDCLNAGCVPSKALIASARVAHTLRNAARFGIANDEPRANFRAVHDHVQGVIAAIAPHDSIERFTALGADVIAAEGRFLDRRTLKAGETLIRARRFVIATGSRPKVPDIPGLGDVPYFTNETIFEHTAKLTHLVVIGGGPVGMELAQAYRRLGSQVTVIETAKALGRSDPELAEIALRQLREEGVDIREGTRVTEIIARSQGIGVRIAGPGGEPQILDASHILVATGRQASLDGLDLEKARVRRDPINKARLLVKDNLKTSNRRIYAIGDAAGGLQFTHAAGYQGGLVVRNAVFGLPVRKDDAMVPKAVFTDPEIAEVGLTEPQAKARFRTNYKVVRWSFAENDRARSLRQTQGVAKMITDRNGRIIGAGIVGPDAGELITLFSFAIANRLSARHLMAFVAPYPTLSEIAKRLGTEFYRDATANPWLQRLMALNRLLP